MQQSLEHLLDQMVTAWDSGDAQAYASLFTPTATYVTFAGSVSSGRDAIARDHEPVLTRFQRGSRMRMRVTSTRLISDDVAIVVSEGGISKGKRIPLDKVQTFVLERQLDGTWLCSAFQNSKKNRLMIWLASRGGDRA
ncbi:SgcJ/EcaC family oxidoreductase [Promicromonospora sp. Populi]|uniref:SgcJ/EcaC family oxidoreductase n=1 Tax=Promicromonospora sp. Populi TaxID=3239420 RepID=UPI0034E26BEA